MKGTVILLSCKFELHSMFFFSNCSRFSSQNTNLGCNNPLTLPLWRPTMLHYPNIQWYPHLFSLKWLQRVHVKQNTSKSGVSCFCVFTVNKTWRVYPLPLLVIWCLINWLTMSR